ncbi:type IX secretion system protein PorG [Natronoflexus pectinivorans]|uniref:Opacity protein-like surface antigen n=1 Tax=Natronoflexus pectinivorans TaxID=682526 RepID=A0A4R2GMB7_9BACT|nr:DUF6089 family protein [Natronoflexus pectinivorans]TCO10405.1 opacity protein-like surface antigen [Natronoflexus pectinivorans]
MQKPESYNSLYKHLKSGLFLAFLFIGFLSAPVEAQTKIEGGPFLGISWYNGDLNPDRMFYNIHPSIGGIIRYNVNDRIAFRGGLQLAGLSGSYPEFNDVHLREYDSAPYSFKRNVIDLSTLLEINFFSFDHPHRPETIFTPYVALGVASTFYTRYEEVDDNHSEKPTFVLSLPFGAGVKWKVTDWFKLGAEWTFRKTFTDDLDVVGTDFPVNPGDPFGFGRSNWTHNNDWYSIVGVYATFNIFTRDAKCYDGFHNRGRR